MIVSTHSSKTLILRRIAAQGVAEAAADALGGELDGGQRVLDLVRDTPGDLAPRRHALNLDDLGVVVEDDRGAERPAGVVVKQGRGHEQAAELSIERNLHLTPAALAQPGSQPLREILDHVQDLRAPDRVRELRPDHAGSGRNTEVALSRRVHRTDPGLSVDRDHTGADRAEHHLHVATPLLDLRGRLLEVCARVAQITRHAVERFDQQADLVVRVRLDLHVEISARDLGGAFRQRSDRPGHPLGKPHAEPEGQHQHHHGRQQQLEQVGSADMARRRLQGAILGERRANALDAARQRVGHEGIHDHHARGRARTARSSEIAAVEGFALAGGLEIALSCDLIVAAKGVKLGIPEVNKGLFAAGGGLFRLPTRVPYGVAMEMALTSDPISAEQGHELGLVTRLAEPGKAAEEALALAERIARNAPLGVAMSKQVIRQTRGMTEEEAWAFQAPFAGKIFASEDAKEGPRAFAEKREPKWTGR